MAEKNFITCDGNYAAAYISYLFSEISAVYPITPSSTMAELVDQWSSEGKTNIFGQTVKVIEMQSEGGAVATLHGALQSGVLASTYTASQGLLLMLPNMYKIAGELLPAVFHVSARSVASHALSIFGDHSDVMAVRQTGFAMLASANVQEAMDLAAVAHLSAIKARVPFMHFFDGFRTSHEIQKIEKLDEKALLNLIDKKALSEFRQRALNPNNPVTRGTAQNPDVFFQNREASNLFYDNLPDIVEGYMKNISEITGREYKPFNYYGAEDAENIIIAMGSVCDTIKESVNYLNSLGKKTGVISVHLYRPFSAKHFLKVLPESVKVISVLDRTKESGAIAEPLLLDVKSVLYLKQNAPKILGGRYGLSSKDVTPADIISVFENAEYNESKERFTIGIKDDVTFLSLPEKPNINLSDKTTFEAKFYGIGSDGTVGANKNTIKIIGENTDKYCQAYFSYDSKKSGGFTTSHLRFGDKPINSPYLIENPDLVACHIFSYLQKYDVLSGIKQGGTFLLNSIYSAEETKKRLPDNVKRILAEKEINFYIINATRLARTIGLGNRTNTILQSAFFKISDVIAYQEAERHLREAVFKSYSKKGSEILEANFKAIEVGGNEIEKVEVEKSWLSLAKEFKIPHSQGADAWITDVVDTINAQKGDELPVSAFIGKQDGTMPQGSAAYEKRAIANFVPKWIAENCIECNQCAFVCPHAAIRPFLLTEKEKESLPFELKTKNAVGAFKGLNFRIQVAPLDCTGCNNCVSVCPSKEKSLVMEPLDKMEGEQKIFDYLHKEISYKDKIADKTLNVKNSQFAQPLFEYSGACSGCGETPYIKLLTQLFGEKMLIANATGCSSIFSASFPCSPYTKNTDGKGPAWANSLFEDNAEFGLGLRLGSERSRDRIEFLLKQVCDGDEFSDDEKQIFNNWIENRSDSKKSDEISHQIIKILSGKENLSDNAKEIVSLKDFLAIRSNWIIGGDGWAYDIGYGGLDHVLASGENVNILVLDTEVYSNTGGQSSKSTPLGAITKFASSGKKLTKKDLGVMAMSYGYVYVAQVAMGANNSQLLKALKEAEQFDGPSIVIAYSPCISHGIKGGLNDTQMQEKLAVECGYWNLYRYNPDLENEGKNPFTLDSKQPQWENFESYLLSETRFSALKNSFPEKADEIFKAIENQAKRKYDKYKKLSE